MGVSHVLRCHELGGGSRCPPIPQQLKPCLGGLLATALSSNPWKGDFCLATS